MSLNTHEQKVRQMQRAILCLLVCLNLSLMLALLAAYAVVADVPQAAGGFLIAALIGLPGIAWLGLRIHRYPVFLKYRHAVAVYVPGMLLSLALPVALHLLLVHAWGLAGSFSVILLSGGLFLALCQGIKLNTARHALD
jgi:hypothetical protein